MIQRLIHNQRPAVIVEAHGHAKIVRMLSALILNFVPRLRDRIAEASENYCRNHRYPEILQTS
jgi:hypothetical protein